MVFAAIANLDDDPTMATTFHNWCTTAAEAIQRGMVRGDLPSDMDVQFTLDIIVGVVFQRSLPVAQPVADGLDGPSSTSF